MLTCDFLFSQILKTHFHFTLNLYFCGQIKYIPMVDVILGLQWGDEGWTILVQEVDRHIPRMADIWQKYFDFIPSWRRDDIMVSYAAPGGGIGAHVDSYDVFLVQGR